MNNIIANIKSIPDVIYTFSKCNTLHKKCLYDLVTRMRLENINIVNNGKILRQRSYINPSKMESDEELYASIITQCRINKIFMVDVFTLYYTNLYKLKTPKPHIIPDIYKYNTKKTKEDKITIENIAMLIPSDILSKNLLLNIGLFPDHTFSMIYANNNLYIIQSWIFQYTQCIFKFEQKYGELFLTMFTEILKTKYMKIINDKRKYDTLDLFFALFFQYKRKNYFFGTKENYTKCMFITVDDSLCYNIPEERSIMVSHYNLDDTYKNSLKQYEQYGNVCSDGQIIDNTLNKTKKAQTFGSSTCENIIKIMKRRNKNKSKSETIFNIKYECFESLINSKEYTLFISTDKNAPELILAYQNSDLYIIVSVIGKFISLFKDLLLNNKYNDLKNMYFSVLNGTEIHEDYVFSKINDGAMKGGKISANLESSVTLNNPIIDKKIYEKNIDVNVDVNIEINLEQFKNNVVNEIRKNNNKINPDKSKFYNH